MELNAALAAHSLQLAGPIQHDLSGPINHGTKFQDGAHINNELGVPRLFSPCS